MENTVGAAYDPEKEYELAIARWEVAVPADWGLHTRVQGEYQAAAGRKVVLELGDRLKAGPTDFMQGALNQGFIQAVTTAVIPNEVHTDDDSQ